MVILRPDFLRKHTEIVCGISGRYGSEPAPPFENNMSYIVDENREKVSENRRLFFSFLGLNTDSVAWQSQIHGDTVCEVNSGGNCGESDAMITSRAGLGLAVSIADCTPVLMYATEKKVIAAVHAGWRGTAAGIVDKTIKTLLTDYQVSPGELNVYIGPSMKQRNYEVGPDTAEQFPEEFVRNLNNKLFLDVPGANRKQVLQNGVPEENIVLSALCSYEEEVLLHSYRRDKNNSGRSLALIYRKEIL